MREQSAYVAEEPELRNLKVLFSLMVFLIITDFVMPQYFGIHIGYDLTCTRLADLLIVLYMFLNRKILTHFGDMVIHHIFIIPFAIYLFVSIYTMVCRVDISGNPYLLHFSLRDSVYRGLEKGNKIKHRMCIFFRDIWTD